MIDSQPTHAMSRYSAVTINVIEKCQQDYYAGRDLGQSIPGLSATKVTIIVAESLEADSLWQAPPEVVMKRTGEPLSDWSLAILAEIFFALRDQIRQMAHYSEERFHELQARAWTSLERVLDSPTASPMLWYEDIFFDVAQQYRRNDDRRASDMIKRGLAHSLYYNEGTNAENFLRDLAETYLWLDELDRGLEIFTGLLRHNPADIWTFNSIAFVFKHIGLNDLGVAATQRGLELLDTTGDPEGLSKQLSETLADLQQSPKPERETDLSPGVAADFRAALRLGFEDGQHLEVADLACQLVPDLDSVPVKRPPEKPKLPPAQPSHRNRSFRQTGQTLGRNDPCWCGSGKKYKQCHLRADRQRGTK